MTLAVEIAGESLRLMAQRALYWPRARTLFTADWHLGKAATFRAAAIPVPEATTDETLARLDQALASSGAERLVCLGDLLHARSGRSPALGERIAAWRRRHAALDLLLIRGNHDRHAGDPPESWRIVCHDEPYPLAPFVLRHYPEPDPRGYVLAGHHHPAIRIGRGALSERLPCFHFTGDVGLLPAAGAFTGSAAVRANRGDRVYVIAGAEIIEIPQAKSQ